MPRRAEVQWLVLLVLSLALVAALTAVRLPAAMLLGTMAAAIALATTGGAIRVPERLFVLAQAVLGCLIARSIPLPMLGVLLRDWPLFLGTIVAVIAVATLLGGLLTRWRVLPGTAAIWGSSPGAATAMILMAEAYGADIRLVAVMQYLRVVCVAAVASLVSRLWIAGPVATRAAIDWFPTLAWGPLAGTLALAGFGAVAARPLRIPAGPMLLPLALGIALQGGGWLRIELPPWLLAITYAMVGWSIGLRFTRPILIHAARALPRILASILALIALCGALAALLVAVAGIDPLTAYLATSPGGADSVAIIAASSTVDLPFVMTMQTGRFLVVLLAGPSLARLVARRLAGTKPKP